MAECKEHNKLSRDIQEIKTDIALIKQSLLGNFGKKDGIVDKVNQHDKYLYMIAGMLVLISFALANFSVFIK